jgi:hypothetical protein
MSNMDRKREPERAEVPEDMRKLLDRQKNFERNAFRTAFALIGVMMGCVLIFYLGQAGILKNASGWLLVAFIIALFAGIGYSRVRRRD